MTTRLALLAVLLVALVPSSASGQDTEDFQLPEPHDVLPLHRGTPAPRDGLLIDAADLLNIQQTYERMRYLLTRTAQRDTELCDVRVQIEHAHVVAAEERLTLRDDLWGARQTELAQQVAAAETRAQHAAERQWWESPAVWLVAGGAIVGAIWIATAVH